MERNDPTNNLLEAPSFRVGSHQFTGGYNWGIQDEFKHLWCWFKRIEYKEKTYIGTCGAHCNLGIRSAHRWDKEEFKDPVVRNRL